MMKVYLFDMSYSFILKIFVPRVSSITYVHQNHELNLLDNHPALVVIDIFNGPTIDVSYEMLEIIMSL